VTRPRIWPRLSRARPCIANRQIAPPRSAKRLICDILRPFDGEIAERYFSVKVGLSAGSMDDMRPRNWDVATLRNVSLLSAIQKATP